MANGWSPERKTQQRKAIYRWRPWEKSTGPKTTEGKLRTSRNSLKHGSSTKGARAEIRAVRELLAAE